MSKETKLGVFLILVVTVVISFAFFAESMSQIQKTNDRVNRKILKLTERIDSLENVINTSFKNQKDTLLIQVIPQQVKVYYNKETK